MLTAVMVMWTYGGGGLVAKLSCDSCNPVDCGLPGSSVYGNSLDKNTGVGCQLLLQGIFSTQELNPRLLHCRQIIYQLSCNGSPCGCIHLLKTITLFTKMHFTYICYTSIMLIFRKLQTQKLNLLWSKLM